MINGKTIAAMIPARMGSERLRQKNLVLLNDRPLIGYAVEAAKDSEIFDRIVVNSDGKVFEEIAREYEVDFYLRDQEVANSQARADEVVNDFILNNKTDVIVWVNPTSPLQTGQEIRRAVECFFDNNFDTLISTKVEQVHCNFGGKPLNYKLDEPFAKTQDLVGVERFVYSVMMWRVQEFLREYQAKRHAFFVGKVGFFPVSKLASIIVKTKEDVELCKYIIEGQKQAGKLEYYKSGGR
ncbi:hypothetical protein HQ584_04325 [Patescibacteria group bacterium]|nr:hypothetical protein [Patescibacteria group bacterium]